MYLERLHGGLSILEVRFLPTCLVLLYFDNDPTVIHSCCIILNYFKMSVLVFYVTCNDISVIYVTGTNVQADCLLELTYRRWTCSRLRINSKVSTSA